MLQERAEILKMAFSPQLQKRGMETAEGGGAGCAQVVFRVRCDKIGHGESLFLTQTDPIANRVSKFIRMYTSSYQYISN